MSPIIPSANQKQSHPLANSVGGMIAKASLKGTVTCAREAKCRISIDLEEKHAYSELNFALHKQPLN